MSLIGPFINSGNVYVFEELAVPCEIDLGSIPRMQFFEELKCIVETPAPLGTTFKVIDQNDTEITKITKKIFPDRQGIFSATNILTTDANTEVSLRGIFEGPAGTVSLFFIKKLWRKANE